MKNHNTFIWPKALFEDTKIETKVNFEYDEEKLEQLVSALLCMKEESKWKELLRHQNMMANSM